jgi:dimethylargininase
MLCALTREPSPAIGACELTCIQRVPIDPRRVARQHRAYTDALSAAGCTLIPVPQAPDCPDGVFVEDCAVVVEGVAVITRPGAPSRRAEVESVAKVLSGLMPVERLLAPATLDGGDVLRIGRTLFVGRSGRTNVDGIRQLTDAVASTGLEVEVIEVRGALHLKTAVTAIDPETLVINPRWVDPLRFRRWRTIEVDPAEPFAANTLRVADSLVVAAAHPRTSERCAALVPRMIPVEVDEIARAEGGVTCCSILVDLED